MRTIVALKNSATSLQGQRVVATIRNRKKIFQGICCGIGARFGKNLRRPYLVLVEKNKKGKDYSILLTLIKVANLAPVPPPDP